MRERLPICTLALCAIATIVYALPQLQAPLVYNRAAVATGELWRLASGNLVHFSSGHLAKDIAALFLAGALIEMLGYRHFLLLCVVSAFLIGLELYALEPAVLVYGGLSGVAVAAFAYLGLHGATDKDAYGRICRLALIGLVAKIGLEFAFAPRVSDEFVLVPMSHAIGALAASVLFTVTRLKRTQGSASLAICRV